jgi:phage-related protein
MTEGFKIADAYVSVVGDIDRMALNRSSDRAAQEAGRTLGEKISQESSRTLGQDSKGRFVGAGLGIGSEMGDSAAKGMFSGLSGGLGILSALGTNPYVAAAGLAIGAALVPMIGAGLAAGVTAGTGLGVIGLGAFLLREEPRLVKEANRLGDTATKVFTKAAQPMVLPFERALNQLGDLITELGPDFRQMFADVAPAITPLTHGLFDLVRNAMPGLLELTRVAGPMLTDLAPSIAHIGTAFSIFAGQIAGVGPEATVFFKDFLTWVGGTIIMAGYLIGWLTKAYVAIRTFFVSIPGWVSSAWSAIQGWGSSVGSFFTSTVPGWFSSLWSTITGWVSGVASAIGGFFTSTVPGWFSSAWSTISGFGSAIGGFFARLPGQIIGFLASLPGRAVALFVSLFDMATFAIGYGIGTVIGFFAALPGRVMGFFTLVGSAVMTGVNAVVGFFTALPGQAAAGWNAFRSGATSAFNATRTAISNAISAGVNAVVGFFTALPGRAASAVSSLWSRISGAFTSARSQAQSTASSLVSGVVSFLSGLPGKAASAVSSTGSRIAGQLRGAVNSARSIGADIIRGMISGINSMIGAAVSAAKRAVGNIISGAKSALKIGSPSKVARDEIGRWYLPGIVEGVKKTLPAAKRAVGAATAALVPTIRTDENPRPPALLGRPGGGYGGDTYNFAPGSVVLDASKIKDIQDVVELIGGINRSARGYYAGAAT